MYKFDGIRVRIARNASRERITQSQLGLMVDRSQPSISAYESGAIEPPHEVARRIAAALNVPVNELYADDGGENVPESAA